MLVIVFGVLKFAFFAYFFPVLSSEVYSIDYA